MQRRTAIAGTLAIGTAGALLLASPVLAAAGPGNATGRNATTTTCADLGTDAGRGMAARGGMTQRMGGTRTMGNDPGAALPASGTLTADQKTKLAAMADEEKLAHDVYTTLATTSGDARFTRIAAAEQRHLDAVRVLLVRYSVPDPTAGQAAGQFTTPATAATYKDLVAQGSTSLTAALTVGRTIETTDIADLRTAGTGVSAADVTTVYTRLSAASSHHLAAFGG